MRGGRGGGLNRGSRGIPYSCSCSWTDFIDDLSTYLHVIKVNYPRQRNINV